MTSKRGLPADALLLFLLLLARVRIDTLADMVLPNRHQDVARHPFLGHIISPKGMKLLADWLTDPISLMLIAIAFGIALVYLVLATGTDVNRTFGIRLALVWLILIVTIVAPTGKLIMLRHQSGPASYCHDGGVIQTEEATKLFLRGRSPYVEDYTKTPLASWGIKYHSAVYHYPYLPWTFVLSAPFYLATTHFWGWFDERLLYLTLFLLLIAIAPALADAAEDKLMLTMILGLNPIMGLDTIFGQNDLFVLFWIALAFWLWTKWRKGNGLPWALAASASYGLACASKPTAWYLAPFFALLLLADGELSVRRWKELLLRSIPAIVVFLALVLPYAIWDFGAMLDDIWKWSAGTSSVPYQITGWGASNFVLALGLVPDKLAYWPFWVPELLVGLPLLVWLLWRQWKSNTLANASWHFGLLLFGFFYVSRFMNENYLGFILALFAIGYFAWDAGGAEETR